MATQLPKPFAMTTTHGGARANAGRLPKPAEEKKVTLTFYVKSKHVAKARAKCQPIIDKLNK